MRKKREVSKIEVEIEHGHDCWVRHKTVTEKIECSYPGAIVIWGSGKYALMVLKEGWKGYGVFLHNSLDDAETSYRCAEGGVSTKEVRLVYFSSRSSF